MKKKSHWGHKGADAKTSLSLVIIRYTAPSSPLFLGAEAKYFFAPYKPDSAPYENISASPIKSNLPLIKKNGHASDWNIEYL